MRRCYQEHYIFIYINEAQPSTDMLFNQLRALLTDEIIAINLINIPFKTPVPAIQITLWHQIPCEEESAE